MKILKVPMRKYSTLIYIVNANQSENISEEDRFTDDKINRFLATSSEKDKLPSELVIENILNFARSYEAFETADAGYVEMNLN